jgi:hypothetical protein
MAKKARVSPEFAVGAHTPAGEIVEVIGSVDQFGVPSAIVVDAQPVPSEMLEALGAPAELIKAVEAQQVEAPKVEKKARLGVGKFVMNLIKTQPELTNQQLLEEVYKEFGDKVKTTKACIAWYKTASKKI